MVFGKHDALGTLGMRLMLVIFFCVFRTAGAIVPHIKMHNTPQGFSAHSVELPVYFTDTGVGVYSIIISHFAGVSCYLLH